VPDEQALAYVFSKTCDFQEFLRTPEVQRIMPTLRIRRAPAPETAKPPVLRQNSIILCFQCVSESAICAIPRTLNR